MLVCRVYTDESMRRIERELKMEKWKVEQARNLQDRIDQLEYEADCINNLEAHEFCLGYIETNLGYDYFLEETEMDTIRDILLTAVNREILRMEQELNEL